MAERMTVLINNHSGVPIYEQIRDQLRRQILSGALEEGRPLPSIRSLAKELRISVITTKRAYEELEGAGLIYTLPGKGSFVSAKSPELLREEHRRELEEQLRKLRELSRLCGLTKEELWELYDLLEEEA